MTTALALALAGVRAVMAIALLYLVIRAWRIARKKLSRDDDRTVLPPFSNCTCSVCRNGSMLHMRQQYGMSCPGPSSSGCTCTGSCGGTAHCLCRACAAMRPWLPKGSHGPARRPPNRRSRASGAGIEGFDGAGLRKTEAREDFGLAIGSVRGLRQWNFPVGPELNRAIAGDVDPGALLGLVSERSPLLRGATGGPWNPGINEAVCNNYKDHAPPVEFDQARDRECGCGFWGYWKLEGAPAWNHDVPVLGIIEGTGRVLIGSKGFRCQKARILALTPAFVVEATRNPWATGEASQEVTAAEERAQAWMGVAMDALGMLYPGARVFATLKAMLATFPPGEVTS